MKAISAAAWPRRRRLAAAGAAGRHSTALLPWYLAIDTLTNTLLAKLYLCFISMYVNRVKQM